MIHRRVLLLFSVAAFSLCLGPLSAADPSPQDVEFFEKRVRPILADHCYKCHSTEAKKPKGGLLVDSRAGLLKGGDNGPALVPGDPAKSRFILAITYKDTDLQMPPKGKLPDAAIADLTAWVKKGAAWPGDTPTKGPSVREEFDLQKRKQAHWAWQAVRPQSPPLVKDTSWPRDPVDTFLLAKLEAKGLKPAAPADPHTLLRRLYFDLIGLPPTPEDVGRISNPSDLHGRIGNPSYEQVADRLLASQHFGERWGRHWLDLVRYGETRGHEFDYAIPNAFQYRDYVIRALNADVPYNQFVVEHLAGDLLPQPRQHPTEGFNESVLGTGFWFLGEEVHSPVDIRADQADRFDNRIDVLTKTFLGLTVSCARCHDHKFDAISTKDYYALSGFLESSSYRQVRFDAHAHNRRLFAEVLSLRARSERVIREALAESLKPGLERMSDYLLSARQAIRTGLKDDRLGEVARARQLDTTLLRRWVAHLRAAAKDEQDPFHAWTRVETLPQLVAAWHKRAAEVEAARERLEEVIHYGNVHAKHWLPDDVGFLQARAGDFQLGIDPARPIVRVIERSAAERDPAWNVLKSAPNTEMEPGALGNLLSAGRTIRTPTFAITHGKVYYLVRGTGRAYAAVGQHIMINGPLHKPLVQPIKTGERFQWVAHDLTPYRGLRTHIEFTAAENADFAVALVVQADRSPGTIDSPNRLLLEMLDEEQSRSPEGLAAAYQQLFRKTLARLAEEEGRGADGEDAARLENWLVQRPDLFVADRTALEKRMAEASGPFLANQAHLLARIRAESRLAPAMWDGSGQDEHVFIRGSPKALGELVPRRFLEALAGPQRLGVRRGSGRLELAQQMTDPATNPLIARVIVNRVWHYLFGRGLVGSVDNFGVLGELPTHPELLDYLADEFVRDGWSIKKLVRRLVQTRAYQMASEATNPDAEQADPEDLLLHRMRLRRLQGEAIRDAMLAVSGRLDRTLFGPPVPTHLTPFMEGRGRPAASGPLDGNGRRSIYLGVRRNFLMPMMLAFDTPSPFSTMGRRTVSNVPAQALILMNDPFVHQQAELWAMRVLAQPGTTAERIGRMYLSAFGRSPTETELTACVEFLNRQGRLASAKGSRPAGDSNLTVWKDLAHALFNVKEFVFVK